MAYFTDRERWFQPNRIRIIFLVLGGLATFVGYCIVLPILMLIWKYNEETV